MFLSPTARIVALLVPVALMLAPPAHAQCAGGLSCNLVWADEFDGSQLDTTKWSYQLGTGCPALCGWGNEEEQYYTTSGASVDGGMLTITAREENVGGRDYTSARIRTISQGDWTYGRFEMRAKLPEGQGMWPAFWMLPTDPSIYGVWAASGEIDIMESIGSDPDRIYGTIHYGGSFPDNTFSGSSIALPTGSASNDFHVYAVEWDVDEIRWYIDDTLYSVRNSWFSANGPFPAPFDVPFHLILNLAVGGTFPGSPDGSTVFPQEYVVDYVRVYELPTQGSAPVELLFDNMEHGNPLGAGYFIFSGGIGNGGIGASSDVPPLVGGNFSLDYDWNTGGTPGFYGGFGRTNPLDLTDTTEFVFWINPDAGQDYRIEINLQDDDNNDGATNPTDDDEFQFNCDVSPSGPCAIAGGGWQEIRIPLTDFFLDNSFLFGGNNVLDPFAGGNGQLINVVLAIVGQSGSDVSFRTDLWSFFRPGDVDGDGVNDQQDNCLQSVNTDQRDSNGDGYGNVCDADLSNDCIVNAADLGLLRAVFFTADADADFDGDGVVNVVDLGVLKDRFFAAPGPSGTTTACEP